jgi:hypothetical protein
MDSVLNKGALYRGDLICFAAHNVRLYLESCRTYVGRWPASRTNSALSQPHFVAGGCEHRKFGELGETGEI